MISPIITRDYRSFLANHSLRKELVDRPFAYFGQLSGNSITITEFTCNRFEFATTTNNTDSFYLFQEYHPRWKAFIDGKEITIAKSNEAFLGIAVPTGSHRISFIFTAWPLIRICMYVSLLMLFCIFGYFLVKLIKKYRTS